MIHLTENVGSLLKIKAYFDENDEFDILVVPATKEINELLVESDNISTTIKTRDFKSVDVAKIILLLIIGNFCVF